MKQIVRKGVVLALGVIVLFEAPVASLGQSSPGVFEGGRTNAALLSVLASRRSNNVPVVRYETRPPVLITNAFRVVRTNINPATHTNFTFLPRSSHAVVVRSNRVDATGTGPRRVLRSSLSTNLTLQAITNFSTAPVVRTNASRFSSSALPGFGPQAKSSERIEPRPGGAVARFGQHKVVFANNLNTVGAISVVTSDCKLLRSNVLGLSYYDTS